MGSFTHKRRGSFLFERPRYQPEVLAMETKRRRKVKEEAAADIPTQSAWEPKALDP